MPKTKSHRSSSLLKELKIIKAEIRHLKEENKLTVARIRVLTNKLEDEAALIREQNLEYKDAVLGEIKDMHDELTVTLGQYARHEETLENHEERISRFEQKNAV
jgi:chromosome segregation ATPase